MGFIVNRVAAIQAGLDSWQSEQINRKLYYLSFLSIIFLPLSIITGSKFSFINCSELFQYFQYENAYLIYSVHFTVFGMNVGGVPWTAQRDPALQDGFRNVMILCVVMLFLLLVSFSFPSLYARVNSWRRRHAMRRSWSINRKSFLSRTFQRGGFQGGGYMRI